MTPHTRTPMHYWLILLVLAAACSAPSPTVSSPEVSTQVSTLDKKKPKPPKPPDPPTGGGPLSLSAKAWQDPLDTNVPLSNDATGALTFVIPTAGHSVNYLITTGPKAPTGALSATLVIAAPDYPVFVAQEGGEPRWRLLIMAHGTNWSDPDARWWSNPASADIKGGTATVTASLTPDQWSNVNGQAGSSRPEAFAAALRDVSHYGLTFGGQFFGHGVFIQYGLATVRVTDYRVLAF